MASEFYDIGKQRADPAFIHDRIRARREHAMVVNHDTDQLEVWVSGALRGTFASDNGVAANGLLRRETGADD